MVCMGFLVVEENWKHSRVYLSAIIRKAHIWWFPAHQSRVVASFGTTSVEYLQFLDGHITRGLRPL